MQFLSLKKTIIATFATVCLLSSGSVTANANTPNEIAQFTASENLIEISPEIKDLYDPHVTTDISGNYIIKSSSSLTREHKIKLQKILDSANNEYRLSITELPRFVKATGHQIQAAGGGVTFHWWGKTLWLDNLNSYRLSALLAGGAGIAAVAAFITSVTGVGGVVAGGLAAGLTLASGASLVCNWNMRGINLHLPTVGGAWCTPR